MHPIMRFSQINTLKFSKSLTVTNGFFVSFKSHKIIIEETKMYKMCYGSSNIKTNKNIVVQMFF